MANKSVAELRKAANQAERNLKLLRELLKLQGRRKLSLHKRIVKRIQREKKRTGKYPQNTVAALRKLNRQVDLLVALLERLK